MSKIDEPNQFQEQLQEQLHESGQLDEAGQIQEPGQYQESGIPQEADAYINYYGLSGDPFSQDKPLFFTTPHLEKLLRLFNYLARFSSKLVVLSGDTGAGKTALLESFVNAQNEQDLICCFAALRSDSPKQVMREIAEQLGFTDIAALSTPEFIQEIQSFSLARLDEGRSCIVVIDDAHLFDTAVLEQLYQLILADSQQRCSIRLLLCGQEQLLEQVKQVVPTEVAGKTLFHQQISPLSYKETQQYLQVHFRENAGHSKPPFNEAEYQRIHEQSGGLPGAINELAKQVMTESVSKLVDAEPPAKITHGFVAVLCILAVMVGAAFWWHSQQEDSDGGAILSSGLTGQIDRAAEQDQLEHTQLEKASAQKPELKVESDPEQIFAEPAATLEKSVVETATAAVAETEVNDPLEALQKSKEPVMPQPQKAPELASLTAENAGQAQQVQAPKADQTSEQPAKTEVDAAAITKTTIQPETETLAAVVEAAKTTPPASQDVLLSRHAERILGLDASEYTLQLMGSNKKQSILATMRKLSADNNLWFFQKVHKGKPWYVLIYGHYANRAAANKAAANLPAALKGVKPWVRRMSAIQKSVKANR